MEESEINPSDPRKIADAIHELTGDDFHRFTGWRHLEELSSYTEIEDVEVFEDEIAVENDELKVPANIYVSLNYRDKDGDESFHDAFPGAFTVSIKDGEAVISDMTVDTSSFFDDHEQE
ncbi:hypothetical protein [Azospirillum brasilense]|uniref:pPIWI-associating nuclease domain-containing protein n=1 Tax=Azospirillum brasilense TaxID=192 RepID=UPI000E0A9A7D|nr:hypothetical protein [Azospirillum brasilense]